MGNEERTDEESDAGNYRLEGIVEFFDGSNKNIKEVIFAASFKEATLSAKSYIESLRESGELDNAREVRYHLFDPQSREVAKYYSKIDIEKIE